jgi:hypothetical protein
MALAMLQHKQQQAPPPQHAAQYVSQHLLHGYKPLHIDLQLQEQLQTQDGSHGSSPTPKHCD